jgi:outer membrane protein assembly factor BamB
MKRALAAGLLFTLLAACQTVGNLWDDYFGSGGKRNVPAALVQFNPSVAIQSLASAHIGSAEGSIFSPALTKDSVFAANYDGKIARFDANTLAEKWRIDVGKKLSGGVGAADNLVVVGTAKGDVLAYDFNGKALWQARVSSEVLSAPQISGGVVLVRSGDGRIFALSSTDGKRKWLYQRATPALTVRSHAGVLLDKNAVFAGFGGGKLVALETETGVLGWEASVALPHGVSELERIADVTSNPVSDGREVCAVAFQGRVACFEPQSGNLIWARDISSIAGMAIDARNVYVSDAGGTVHALDKSSGAYVWKQEKLANRQLSAPLVYRGYVVVGDLDGYVHFLSREDGAFAGRIATDGSPIRAQPQALNEGVLIQTKKGGLFVLGLK